MIRFARSRRGSGRSRCKSRRPAIEARRRGRGYASPRISCRDGRGARRASTRCCRFSTCAAISAGDFQEALAALLGKDAPNLSPAVIARLKGEWEDEYRQWQQARSVGAPIRLRLGGRRLFAGAHGAAGRVHAGADRRDAGRQEGADRLPDGHARERAELEGTAGRLEGARPGGGAASSPSATARSASGRPSTRRSRRRAISAAGCTRR